jgi:uncharacterized damage-inducible protein DinB
MSNTLIDALRLSWQINFDQVEALMVDVPAGGLTHQPGGVVNHPAWTLSHLNHYRPAILALIGNHPVEDPGRHPDASRYDEGSVPVDDPACYPPYTALLAAYRGGHERVADALRLMDRRYLTLPPRLERWATVFGTTARTLQYLMSVHESHHVGQLMVWRRALLLSEA